MKSRNACDVLPVALVREIQKHYRGGLLWIPVSIEGNRERNDLIVRLAAKGESLDDIARLAGLTPRWVRELVRQAKNGGETGAEEK